MRHHVAACLAVGLLAGCGGNEIEASSPSLPRQQAPLTTTDVDVAPECQGILTFANTGTYQELDEFLPSDVASNLVARRATAPFTSLADVSSVRLVGPARLEQLTSGARANGFIGSSCVGVMDGLAVSTDDSAALVSLVNSISDSELHDVLPDAWNGAVNLLDLRPFTSAQAISNTSGIGEVSLRNLRNSATLSRPFEALVTAVNAVPSDGSSGGSLARHFDWWQIATARHYREGGMECFGLEPSSVPYGATVRPSLATATEVHNAVANALAIADPNHQVSSDVRTAGLANLDARTAGRSFKGCNFSYSNDPWSRNTVSFFVDTVNGFSVLTETYWSE